MSATPAEPSNDPDPDSPELGSTEDAVEATVENKCSTLCGYLIKSSSQKLLKKSKRYWFVYAATTCKLYYFNSAESTQPCGSIDIGGATFSLEVDNPTCPGLFKICTPSQCVELEAPDRNTALYWLQELQKYRRKFSKKRTANIKRFGVSYNTHIESATGGLLKDQALAAHEADDDSIPPLVIPVEPTDGLVGDSAAKFEHSSSSNVFSNFRSEFRNGIINICSPRSSESSISTTEDLISPSSPTTPLQIEQKIFAKAGKLRSSFRRSLPFLSKESTSPNASTIQCTRCEKLKAEVVELKDTVMKLSDEVNSSKEMIHFLQRQLDLACRQKESVMKIQVDPNTGCHMQLAIQKDIELAQLNNSLDEMQKELEDTRLQYMALAKESKELHKYDQEIIQLKNEVIHQLTEQVTALEMEKLKVKIDDDFVVVLRHRRLDSSSETLYPEYEKLKDELQAFRIQNKFLNSEILQLNLLLKDAEEREAVIKMKCVEWESKYYAIQSKYLVLLNEYHSPASGFEQSYAQETASQLLHEAVTDTSGPDYMNIAKVISSDSRYDIYGFFKSSASPAVSLLQVAYLLRQRSEETAGKLKDSYAEHWISKWDNFMTCHGKRSIQPSPMLKELLRSGIPFGHRSAIWKGCIDLHIKHVRESRPKNYYESLLAIRKQGAVLDMAAKQIELDLLRTLPHNKHFENAYSDGIPKLRRILLAFSRHNQDIEYCQGLNRLAAIALLFLGEEDSFWCLVAIIEFLVPLDYYTRELIGAQVDQLVLKELLMEKLPRLHSHFEKHDMDISLFTFNWFMCIFVDCLPIETYLFIWDSFLYEGNKILFRFALAIFKICEIDCLKAKDSMGISRVLRNVSETLVDWRRLAQIAFNDLNPFPRRTIANKREQYLAVVKLEVEKINLQRATLRTPRTPRTTPTPSQSIAAGPSSLNV